MLFSLFVLLISSRSAFAAIETYTRYTGCVNAVFTDCTPHCDADLGHGEHEDCTYVNWWQSNCGWFGKKCECRCTRQTLAGDGARVTLVTSPAGYTAHPGEFCWDSVDQSWTGARLAQAVARCADDDECAGVASFGREFHTCKSTDLSWSSFRCTVDGENRCNGWQRMDDGSPAETEQVTLSYLPEESLRCGINYPARDMEPHQQGLCPVDKGCCSSGGWCGTTKDHCDCQDCINMNTMGDNCVFDNILKPVDMCTTGTAIDTVQDEILAQQIWNVAWALADEIPVVGTLFDVFFAILDPINHLTPAAGLVMNVETAVNEELAKLRQCLDARIQDVITGEFKREFDEVFHQMDFIATQVDSAIRRDNILDMFLIFTGKVSSLDNFVGYLQTENGAEIAEAYMDLLPHFQVIVSSYAAVLMGALDALNHKIVEARNQGEDASVHQCNFNSYLARGRGDLETLYNWITDAEEAIVGYFEPGTSFSGCTHSEDAANMRDFTRTYNCGADLSGTQVRRVDTHPGGMRRRRFMDYDLSNDQCDDDRKYREAKMSLKMTDRHTCTYMVRGDFMCDDRGMGLDGKQRPAYQIWRNLVGPAQKFVRDARNRLYIDWLPRFHDKYTTYLTKLRETLANVPDKGDDLQCSSMRTMEVQEAEAKAKMAAVARGVPAAAMSRSVPASPRSIVGQAAAAGEASPGGRRRLVVEAGRRRLVVGEDELAGGSNLTV